MAIGNSDPKHNVHSVPRKCVPRRWRPRQDSHVEIPSWHQPNYS